MRARVSIELLCVRVQVRRAEVRTSAVTATGPSDESFPWYSADCDYYHRMRRRGFEVGPVVDGGRVGHVGSATLHNMNGIERGPVDQQSEWAQHHYMHKWGGKTGEERFGIPYNGRP